MTTARRHGEHQTPFGEWLQGNPRLDSRDEKISATDVDMFIHRFHAGYDKVNYPNRLINHIMLLEVKTHSAEPRFAQEDTLKIVNQALMRGKYKSGKCECFTASEDIYMENLKGVKIVCKVWGVHLLQLSNTRPDNGEMLWDFKKVTQYDLECILRFELNPFTLKKIDNRRHHKIVKGKWTS